MQNLRAETIVDGKFEILEELGVGGMGTVYKAKQISIDRIVALKVLQLALLSDEDGLKRFEREANALSSISKPNSSTMDFGMERCPISLWNS